MINQVYRGNDLNEQWNKFYESKIIIMSYKCEMKMQVWLGFC